MDPSIVYHAMDEDKAFAKSLKIAKQVYADRVRGAVHDRAIVGVLEPIIGGRNKDQIVAVKRVYSDRLLERHIEKWDPEYRQKMAVDATIHQQVTITCQVIQELTLDRLDTNERSLVRQLLQIRLDKQKARELPEPAGDAVEELPTAIGEVGESE